MSRHPGQPLCYFQPCPNGASVFAYDADRNVYPCCGDHAMEAKRAGVLDVVCPDRRANADAPMSGGRRLGDPLQELLRAS